MMRTNQNVLMRLFCLVGGVVAINIVYAIDILFRKRHMFDVMLLLVEVEFEWVVVGVQIHFHAKPNSVELS